MPFERPLVRDLATALGRRPALVHVIVGPRQVGKTTAALQVEQHLGWPSVIAAADAPLPHGPEWIETQWQLARTRSGSRGRRVLLVLDEIQKVRGWSEVVKRLWDEEVRSKGGVRPLLLGSSALLVQKGLGESLAGRFVLHRCNHWSWPECREAFGWPLDRWIWFGGYPGAAPFATDELAWKRYVTDSLIDTVLARDVLQMQTVTKPALLRHLFALAAAYPAQILSYTKMLGQLQDAGNTVTLAGYLKLLETAFLASGLDLFTRGEVRKRGSSPKLVLWNNALINAPSTRRYAEARADGGLWGRLVENAVGAHLLNGLHGPQWSITYWRSGDDEVDYVVAEGSRIRAIEVKSGRAGRVRGLAAFRKRWPRADATIVGEGGIPLGEFFDKSAVAWFA